MELCVCVWGGGGGGGEGGRGEEGGAVWLIIIFPLFLSLFFVAHGLDCESLLYIVIYIKVHNEIKKLPISLRMCFCIMKRVTPSTKPTSRQQPHMIQGAHRGQRTAKENAV